MTDKTNVLRFNRAGVRAKAPHQPLTADTRATIEGLLQIVCRTNPAITIAELEAELDALVETGLVAVN